MNFDLDWEAAHLIDYYIAKFGEKPPFGSLEVASLDELKLLLHQAMQNNEPIEVPNAS